ncbi:MAG TPA: hypothetical protein VF581_07740 [Flavobacterium sp.]|jgi:hypothetical protein
MKQLEDTIIKLKTDPFARVSVVEKQTGTKLACNESGDSLTAKFGSVEGFFDDLSKKGIKTIEIFDRKKSGTSHTARGNYNFTFGDPAEVQTQTIIATRQPASAVSVPGFGLMGAGMFTGLSAPEVMQYQAMDYNRLSTEYNILRQKVEAQEATIKTLEKEALEKQFSTAKSEGREKMMFGAIPHVEGIIKALGIKVGPGVTMDPTVGGLAAPIGLSPVKAEMITMIQTADEDFVRDLYVVANGMYVDSFAKELDELIAKHNLLKVPNAG